VGVATFGLIWFLTNYSNLFIGMERALLNGFFYMREPARNDFNPYVSHQARLLGYDEEALAAIGKWPWKRYVHARFLDNIQQFSPASVFFDIIFDEPETAPEVINARLAGEPQTLEAVHAAYRELDAAFARALARYTNVYLDLRLMEQQREPLPAATRQRIAFNEQIIDHYSLPVADVRAPIVFRSLEPILTEFVSHAHPVAINALADDDGTLRMFPLFYTYQKADGSQRNVLSVVSALLLRYYHADKQDLLISPQQVIIRGAKAPLLDPQTCQPVRYQEDFAEIARRLINPDPPAGTPVNANLQRLLANALNADPQGGRLPTLPLHVLDHGQGQLEILQGWEIWQAARSAGKGKIQIIVHQSKDIVIPTPVPGFFHINYAGREKIFYHDAKTNDIKAHTPIATGSYREVWALEDLPDLPALTPEGRLPPDVNWPAVETWFFNHCRAQSQALMERARKDLNDQAADPAHLKGYLQLYPREAKYHHYYEFFRQNQLTPGRLSSAEAEYGRLARQMGLDPADDFSPHQMVEALTQRYTEQFVRYYNQFIFTGGTALGLSDIHRTPYASMAGVNVVINAFNTIATGNLLRFSRDIPYVNPLVLLGLCAMATFFYGATHIRFSSLFFILLLLGTLIGGLISFNTANLFVETVPLIFANLIIFVSMVIYKLLTEEKDKKFLQATFGNYLAPELIEDMYRSKTRPQLGGEARHVTAFFTDIQGFSTFSEILTAYQLVELLNEYLSAMTDILIHEKGTLDKYEGDAIIAFFGAPVDLPDHAFRACRVAVNMQRRLGELRLKWQQEKVDASAQNPNTRNLPDQQWRPGDQWPLIVHQMRMRIGINSGEIVVGNMGSAMRMNYTMMGDAVNLAARLEAAGKQYGVYTLASQYVVAQTIPGPDGKTVTVGDLLALRFIDRLTVVGKSEPVAVYEVLGLAGELTDKEEYLIQLFNQAMGFYLAMQWDKAAAIFSKAAAYERYPDDKTTPSKVFMQRCRAFQQHPPVKPDQRWDGVFRLTEK
jgi:class 3 adenylate cyclase